ncbi:hypothetical protein BST81_02740 [Leptolyngbya sp. 'hensonii']|uniref:VanZ family protein n=1 Tax=Leptolyngbya sp. 'hensonii' TaxID=1922337 RepID=UPI0009501B1C|nr:VanZ family protein [Leptolyngbya sp. 'hensonii']OLP20007.1 hypothetical protein BST81_02740 [Leptolyngbya sp. 'hensonii']
MKRLNSGHDGLASYGWVITCIAYCGLLLGICAFAYLGILPTQLAQIPFYDTIGHFVLLGLASYFIHQALNHRRVRLFSLSLPLGPLLVGLFATSDETIQALSPQRTFSLTDLAASLLGILCFYWLAKRSAR